MTVSNNRYLTYTAAQIDFINTTIFDENLKKSASNSHHSPEIDIKIETPPWTQPNTEIWSKVHTWKRPEFYTQFAKKWYTEHEDENPVVILRWPYIETFEEKKYKNLFEMQYGIKSKPFLCRKYQTSRLNLSQVSLKFVQEQNFQL